MAAKARTLFLSLAAFCLAAFANAPRASLLLTEKPRLGVAGFARDSHRGVAAANALIAPGISGCLCDFGGRSRSTGKERDAETGLDYFGARYYSGAMGRFLSPDRPFLDQHAGNPQSWNLFSYVQNNPLRFVDPNGESTMVCTGGGLGHESTCQSYSDTEYQNLIEKGILIGGGALPSLPSSRNERATLSIDCNGRPCGTVTWVNDDPGMKHDLDVLLPTLQSLRAGMGVFEGRSGLSVLQELANVWVDEAGEMFIGRGSGKNLQRRIDEHKQKLAEYIKDPDAADHLGLLRLASPERRKKIIEGRIKHLEQEIRAFEKALEKSVGKK